MATLGENLQTEVAAIFGENWSVRNGTVVPDTDSLKLRNDAVRLDATVLYADLTASTQLVDAQPAHFAAEVYKAYLHCGARIIRAEGGEITAYDGDRIMAVFLGDDKETKATRAALKINYARVHLINPALKAQYPQKTYEVNHTVGIDSSELFIARTGIRGSNDLVWVGRAANYAAKLTTLDASFQTRISGTVYDNLGTSVQVSSDGRNMWEQRQWTAMNNARIYRSAWTWKL